MESNQPESALERARRLTQDHVDAGRLFPWVMGDSGQRDRYNQARDRREAFRVVDDNIMPGTNTP